MPPSDLLSVSTDAVLSNTLLDETKALDLHQAPAFCLLRQS
jgi:hypothetical protein